MPQIRRKYAKELRELEERTLGGLDLVGETLGRALEVIEHRDMELAELVIADDDRIGGRYLEVHQSILTLLATQAPVATNLRLVAALLHLIKSVERIGDQCVNIAKLVPLAGHRPPVDDDLLRDVIMMGRQVRALLKQAKQAFAGRDIELARDLVRGDDVVDNLNRECFRRAIEVGDDEDRREWATSMLLVARALERMGDNAVDIGEQTAFVVTGLFEEFEEASRSARPVPR